MSFLSRVTRPLEPLDGLLNGLNDVTVRVTPWMWWPASPPARHRPFDAGQHAAYVAWSAAGLIASDALAQRLPEEQRSTGRRLRNERIATALAAVVLWLLFAGAWDRRAARLRGRQWRR